MSEQQDLKVLSDFAQVANERLFLPLPDDWWVGLADIVDSTGVTASGGYKSVNFAGAAVISAVSNALDGDLSLFLFGGDGATIVVEPEKVGPASEALLKVADWVQRELHLEMRVGGVRISQIRQAGFDVRSAFWNASSNARYALFKGGGLEWAEQQLKRGKLEIRTIAAGDDPDLSGLSCQWGPVRSKIGKMISLVVKPAPGSQKKHYEAVTSKIIATLDRERAARPIAEGGPRVKWPGNSIELQSRTGRPKMFGGLRVFTMVIKTVFYWLVFKTSLPVKGFKPDQYRSDIAANADFQKYSDGLMMTLDCSSETIGRLERLLERAEQDRIILYGLHLQDEALITCVVPSLFERSHLHFIDGSGGGYAMAAAQIKNKELARS